MDLVLQKLDRCNLKVGIRCDSKFWQVMGCMHGTDMEGLSVKRKKGG